MRENTIAARPTLIATHRPRTAGLFTVLTPPLFCGFIPPNAAAPQHGPRQEGKIDDDENHDGLIRLSGPCMKKIRLINGISTAAQTLQRRQTANACSAISSVPITGQAMAEAHDPTITAITWYDAQHPTSNINYRREPTLAAIFYIADSRPLPPDRRMTDNSSESPGSTPKRAISIKPSAVS